MKEIMKKGPSYCLRSQGNYFVPGNVKITHYDIQSVKYLAPKIWDLVPDEIKPNSLTKCKHFIKSWSPSECPCRLCITYIAQVGLVILVIFSYV